MDAERWKQIEKLFQSALEQAPEARATFLAAASDGDETLRREVESLLAHQTIAGGALEAAVEDATKLFARQQPQGVAGRRLGPYQILQQIGVGGMGEVYLAEDTRLGRKVALKLLPALYTSDHSRVRRFAQEARAASGLNHPNIITIFEIGQAPLEEGGMHFIATEFVDGQTLRQRVGNAGTPLNETLDILIQITSALAAAHEAGIVHRDIKPENIMLRRDGYIKVLDFGLAKLSEHPASAASPSVSQLPTVALVSTEPGMVMGTVAYMSPEQARGLEIDARTDVFSLGVMSYELLTGQRPFAGATAADVISAILHTEPPPLAAHLSEVPETLEGIVAKAMRKDRGKRYQTSGELLTDLKELKQELELQAGLARVRQPTMRGGAMTDKTGQTLLETAPVAAAGTNEMAQARTTSSAEYLIREIKRHKTGVALVAAAVLIVIAGVGFWLSKLMGQRPPSTPFQNMQLTRLTTTGKAAEAAISPDGKYVVHVMDDAVGQSIWVRHVATSSNVRIVPLAEAQYQGVTFSPDGNYVYYAKQEQGVPANSLYQVPVLGGSPKKITERVHGGITFSPDGKRIAFARWKPGRGDGPRSEKLLIVMNADGSGEQRLASHWSPEVLINSAWSPDGKVIVCTVENFSDGSVSLTEVRVADGTERPLPARKWFNVGRIAWLPDGSGLIVPASDKPSSPPQIWRLAYPGGEAHRITNDLNGYNSVSLTADSQSMVTVQSDQSSNIWIAPGGDASRAKQITFGVGKYGSGGYVATPTGAGRMDSGGGICWTQDSKIVYHSMASGRLDIWIMDADGNNQKQLTSDAGSNLLPSVSPDGSYIVFQSDRAGNGNIWRMDIDGGNPKQLTKDNGQYPSCSPDGKWVVYMVSVSGRNFVCRVPIEGGAPVQVTNDNDVAERPVVSPDGNLIACNYVPPGSDWQLRIAALQFAGGMPAKVFEILTINSMREIRWTADGRALTYIETRHGVSNLRGQSLAGGQPVQLTDFKSDLIFSWDWSRDGKQLAVARGPQTADVVLVTDFK